MKRCSRCGLVASLGRERCAACAAEEFVDASDLIDGRYVLGAELGRGAMGVVHRGRDVTLDRPVAIKLIRSGLAGTGPAISRFRREAAALAAIRNPHVVQVFGFGLHQDDYFFAMELVQGRTLDAVIDDHARHQSSVPPHRAFTILRQLGEGLGAAHQLGIVHRDVKPANVVIEAGSGRPVLIDFGIAVRGEGGPTGALGAGTPAYMAPEQGPYATSPTTGAADVYSLACLAFELLAHRPPFVASTIAEMLVQHAQLAPPRLSALRSDLEPLDAVFARALAKDPALRFSDGAAFAEAFERAAGPWLADALPPSSAPPRSSRTAATLVEASTDGSAEAFANGALAAQPLRVLVVDDDDDFRRFAVRALQIAMFGTPISVVPCSSGEQASAHAAKRAPDLVLLDYDMVGLDGVATLSRLRSLPGGAKARVIVISARAGADDRWRFGVLGVGDFARKPIELETLVDLIGALVLDRAASDADATVVGLHHDN